jgi:hypothetical protein
VAQAGLDADLQSSFGPSASVTESLIKVLTILRRDHKPPLVEHLCLYVASNVRL